MAEDKSRTGRFVAAQGGSYAANKWFLPYLRDTSLFKNIRAHRMLSDPAVIKRFEESLNKRFRSSYLDGIAEVARSPAGVDAARSTLDGLQIEVDRRLAKMAKIAGNKTNSKVADAARGLSKAISKKGLTVNIDPTGPATIKLPNQMPGKFSRYISKLRYGWRAAPGVAEKTAGKAMETAAEGVAKKGIASKVTGQVAKAGGWVVKAPAKLVEKTGGLIGKTAEKIIDLRPIHGLTGGRASGFAKGLVRGATSKVGLAAGFAVAGTMDGGTAVYDVLSDSSLSSGDKLKVLTGVGAFTLPDGLGVGMAKALAERTVMGLMRGADGALFGLPSLILPDDWFGGDDYLNPDEDIGFMAEEGSAARYRAEMERDLRIREANGENVSPKERADAARSIMIAEEKAYARGENVFGGVETTDPDELRKRAEHVQVLHAARDKNNQWRAAMLYDHDSQIDSNAPNVKAVRHALGALASEYRRRRQYIEDAFGSVEAYEANEAGALRGAALHKWKNLVSTGRQDFIDKARMARESDLMNWVNREYGRIQDFDAYDSMRAGNEAALQDLYRQYYVSQGASSDDGTKAAIDAWNNMSSFDQDLLDVGAIRDQWYGTRGGQ